MEQEINDLGKEIARLERQEALEAELNRPVNQPLTSKPGSSRGCLLYTSPQELASCHLTSDRFGGLKVVEG